MVAKEQFNELKKTMKYIEKDGTYYRPIYLDVENNICRVREVKNPHRTEDNTKTYEEASKLFTIEIVTEVVKPDKYFLEKIQEEGVNLTITIRDKRLMNYLTEHLEECQEVIDKLKEFALTHSNKKVKKAAFDVYKQLVEVDEEFLQVYQESYLPKNRKYEYSEKIKLAPIDEEKALIVYMALIRKREYNEDRTKIRYGEFSDKWHEIFGHIKFSNDRVIKIQAFKNVHNTLDELTIEQICEYRENNYKIFKGTEVPKELKELAMRKGVVVTLAENKNKHLSGFDILRKKGKNDTQRLNEVPFGLSENGVVEFLKDIPSQKEIVDAENKLMKILEDDSLSEKVKMQYVRNHRTKVATHKFELFMNRFCLKRCKQKQLLNECCLMCQRNGILNLSNKKPIEYTFCAGSGKRKQTIKRINARRKGNEKAKRKSKK